MLTFTSCSSRLSVNWQNFAHVNMPPKVLHINTKKDNSAIVVYFCIIIFYQVFWLIREIPQYLFNNYFNEFKYYDFNLSGVSLL